MPDDCAKCPNALNCINGKYCLILNKYVNYDRTKKCKRENDGSGV